MQTTVPKTKLYEFAKCVTAILVVIAHTTIMYTPVGAIPVAFQSAFLTRFTNYIYAFHMPLFVMLSGCIYGYGIEKGKYTKFFPFIKNKVKKLLIPYFAFGVLYVAPVMCILGVTNDGYIKYIVSGIILSLNSRHLWYILALFWIFLIFILLRPLLTKGICGLVIMGGISLVLWFGGSKIAPSLFQLPAAFNYQIFFFLGILFNRFYESIVQLFRKFYAIGFVLPFLLMTMFIPELNFLKAYLYKGIGITMVLFFYKGIGIAMAMFFCWCLLRRFPAVIHNSVYGSVKQNAFGIYLFHPMIIYVLYHWLGQYKFSPVFLSAFIWITATLLSVCATKLLRILRLQLLIGE